MEPGNSFKEIQHALRTNETSCKSLVEYYLLRIEASKNHNIYLEVFTDEALARAVAIDEKIKAGTAGRLAGMVIAIKDNICYKNHKVAAASKILENFVSLYSATAVERLLTEDYYRPGKL
jgi:aspartyl-tRNA(Asn)/glutamyl-tRNA(Gln) amidotransferase subunit A